jgi:hypothetical protein
LLIREKAGDFLPPQTIEAGAINKFNYWRMKLLGEFGYD